MRTAPLVSVAKQGIDYMNYMSRSIFSSSTYLRHELNTGSLSTPKQLGSSAIMVAFRTPLFITSASSPKVAPCFKEPTLTILFSSSDVLIFLLYFSSDLSSDIKTLRSASTVARRFRISSLTVSS